MNWQDKQKIKKAVSQSFTYSDTLRNLGIYPHGSNINYLKKYIAKYQINITHFTQKYVHSIPPKEAKPLEEIMIKGSTYKTGHLKKRLYKEGLKTPICEICGQNENWNGKYISLILDHINGINDDHRLENLRIICPNYNATLPTYCGRNNKNKKIYYPKIKGPCPTQRKVIWPTKEELEHMLKTMSKEAIGRKYGVSGNAVNKWIKKYKDPRW